MYVRVIYTENGDFSDETSRYLYTAGGLKFCEDERWPKL